MAGKSTLSRGNISLETIFAASINTPSSVGANTTVIGSYPVQGVLINDFIELNQQSHVTGLSIGNVWASAANTITIQWVNSTGLAITTAAVSVIGVITRCEDTILPAGII